MNWTIPILKWTIPILNWTTSILNWKRYTLNLFINYHYEVISTSFSRHQICIQLLCKIHKLTTVSHIYSDRISLAYILGPWSIFTQELPHRFMSTLILSWPTIRIAVNSTCTWTTASAVEARMNIGSEFFLYHRFKLVIKDRNFVQATLDIHIHE